MNFQEYLDKLQNQPDHIKTRILWMGSTLAIVLVVGVWFTNFKHQIQSISGTNTSVQNEHQTSDTHYFTVEFMDTKSDQTYIYFKAKNDTDDILNFSQAQDIKLAAKGKTYSPKSVLDRQNQPFVKKILSQTQNFGILVFDNIDLGDATITFDNLYFERSPEKIFKEQLESNLSELKPLPAIKN